MSEKRAAAAAYLAEHRLEAVLSDALNAVVSLSATDLVLALGISLRRHAQSTQSHAELERTLHHAALAANDAEARAVVVKVAQQLEVGQKPSVTELRSLEQTLSGLINDVLYDMPTDPIRSIGSGLLRVSSAQHGTVEVVGRLVEAIHEALVAEAHGLLHGLASRLGEAALFRPLVPAVCRRSVVLGQLQGEGRADGCRVHFVASVCCGRLLAPVEQLRHPVAPPSAPLGAAGAAVSVEAQVDEPLTTLVAVLVDPSGHMVGSSGFSLPPWAQGASHQAYQLSLGEAAGRLSFVVSFP